MGMAGTGAADATHVMELAAREVLRIEAKYSRYRKDDGSIVHRINAAAGQPGAVECDPETMALLGIAAGLFKFSDGLFDVTSGILRRAWDFTRPTPPTPGELAPLLKLIG